LESPLAQARRSFVVAALDKSAMYSKRSQEKYKTTLCDG
jgi:hypothetical protein